jgi:hypothetical protein
VRGVPHRAGVATLIAHDDDQSAHLAPDPPVRRPPTTARRTRMPARRPPRERETAPLTQGPPRLLRWARLRGVR